MTNFFLNLQTSILQLEIVKNFLKIIVTISEHTNKPNLNKLLTDTTLVTIHVSLEKKTSFRKMNKLFLIHVDFYFKLGI